MDAQQLTVLFDHIQALRAAGDEEGAKKLLLEQIGKLPEELQAEIMFEMFTDAMQQEAAGLAAVQKIQEEGLAAAEILEKREAEGAK